MRTRLLLLLLLAMVPLSTWAADIPREVAVGNLTYAGTKTSKCFSDAFIADVGSRVAVTVRPSFIAVKSADPKELGKVAFAVMTGEGAFTLTEPERTSLHQWLDDGGFLLASAGCSSPEWGASFRAEMKRMFGDKAIVALAADHPLFHSLNDLRNLELRHDGTVRFEGVIRDGRLAVLFSPEGLNDTKHVNGCCCCGGNEVVNAEAVVCNALVYALVE